MKNLLLKILLVFVGLLPVRCAVEKYPYYIKAPDDVTFSIIIDGSGSMSAIIEDVKLCLNSLLDSMDSDDRMQFIQSGDPAILLNDWSDDPDELRSSIENLTPAGDNERYELAVDFAVEKSINETLHCILLFGDGEIYYEGQPDENSVISSIKKSTEDGNAVLFSLGLGDYNEEGLTNIAKAGKGEFIIIENASEFGENYKEIKQKLKSEYY